MLLTLECIQAAHARVDLPREGFTYTHLSPSFEIRGSYASKQDRTYVVYAWSTDGLLTTGICSRTAEAENAKADLDFLRSLKK